MVVVPHPGKVPTYQQILFFEEVTGILECAAFQLVAPLARSPATSMDYCL